MNQTSWISLYPLQISFIPCCTNASPLVPLVISFLPFVFHWFFHTAPMVRLHPWYSIGSFAVISFLPLVYQWFLQAASMEFHLILDVIILSLGIPIVPFVLHPWYSIWSLLLSFFLLVFQYFFHTTSMIFYLILYCYHSYHWLLCVAPIPMAFFGWFLCIIIDSIGIPLLLSMSHAVLIVYFTVGVMCHSCWYKKEKQTHYRL